MTGQRRAFCRAEPAFHQSRTPLPIRFPVHGALVACLAPWVLATGRAAAQSTVQVIDSSTLGGTSARTLSEVLAGRAPAVTVLRSSGSLGTGSRVRMRGGSGLLIPRAPLLVIDGIRADASQSSLGIDIGGQSPSRLDDIPLDDIERIDVLPGPAGSALYGADAAGGVIVVTTRHGTPGRLHWSSYVESGVTTDAAAYPANSATGPPTYGADTCTRSDEAMGTCVPGPLSQWNPLEQASPFQTGVRYAGGGSVAGGSRALQYYVGGAASGDQGPLPPNDERGYSGRANLDVRPVSSLRAAVRASHVAGRTTLPLGDRYPIGTLYAGMMGNTADDSIRRGYLDNDPATIAGVVTRQRIQRSLGSLQVDWSPLHWLSARGLIGREILHRDDDQNLTMAAVFGDPTRSGPWKVSFASGRDMRTTVSAGATATYALGSRLAATTTIGAERLSQSFRVRDSSSTFFEDGSPAGYSTYRAHITGKTVGSFATQRLVWGPRHLSVGIRRDRGDRDRLLEAATYWSTNVVWNLGKEAFFHPGRALGDLTFRAAYGVAGDTRPLAVVLSTVPRLPPPVGLPPGSPPPPLPSFSPEKVAELEIALDARALWDRITLGATYYRQRSTNSYERGCCVGPFSYDNQGRWHTNGVELTADMTFLRTARSRWEAQLMFASVANRYDGGSTSGSRVLDVVPFFPGARRYLIPGHPIAGVWGHPVTGRDADGDGVIVPTEITRAADSVYLGSSIPTRQLALSTAVTFLRGFTVSVQVDYVGGFTSLNETEAYRCGASICSALYAPNASISDQTRAVAGFGQSPGFQESGDFFRLRDAALSWVVAPDWSGRHGLGRLTLTVAGRNLYLWTDYSGLDSEVNGLGQSSFGTTEFFTLPLPRTLLIRLGIQR